MKRTKKTSKSASRAMDVPVAYRIIGGHYQVSSRLPVLLLSLVSLLLMSLVFAPISWWPLAFFALVPWLTAVCTSNRAGWSYFVSYLFGVGFLLLNMHWLAPVTLPGYVALALFSGALFPIVACPLRHVVRRRRLPVAFVFPILWVASELPRATHTTGLPWFFLGHSMYAVLPVIQIADLVGAHGVSFVIAVVNGWLVDLIIQPIIVLEHGRPKPLGRFPTNTVVVLCVVGGTLIYGFWRLNQKTIHPGPRVAIIQQDFPSYVSAEQRRKMPSEAEKAQAYFARLAESLAQEPDLIALPESPWAMALNQDYLTSASVHPLSKTSHERFVDIATGANTYVLTGGTSLERFPTQVYPKTKQYNSAFLYTPGRPYPQRYDKVHLVLFGEYVPFRYGTLHWFYRWLNSMTPWGRAGYEYSLTAGSTFHTFTMQAKSQDGQVYQFGTPICYEDVIPYCCRSFMLGDDGQKGADFLINISNDGWFNHSAELEQHMAICVFRAVEHRVGIARAVNTGKSGFIDPNGRIHDTLPIAQAGQRVATIHVDTRHSLYSRWGDVFAYACALCAVAMLIDAVVIRRVFRLSADRPNEDQA